MKYSTVRNLSALALILIAVSVALWGCGAPVSDINTIATDAATCTTETLQAYEEANPADAAQAQANYTKMLNDILTAESDAKAMPTSAQIAQDAQEVISIVEDIIAIIPQVTPLFAAKNAGQTLTAKQTQTLDKFYGLEARLQAAQQHQHRHAAK